MVVHRIGGVASRPTISASCSSSVKSNWPSRWWGEPLRIRQCRQATPNELGRWYPAQSLQDCQCSALLRFVAVSQRTAPDPATAGSSRSVTACTSSLPLRPWRRPAGP